MLGDAIAHGVLPGLVIGFALSGSRDLLPMMIGALVSAILVSTVAEWLRERAGVDGQAALGVVFTTLFALGIILIEVYARDVDLDPSCVLYGMVDLAPLNTIDGLSIPVPSSLLPILAILCINIAATLIFWKEWKLCAFDSQLARASRLPLKRLEQGLLALVAVTSVACFEAVGSVLVIAMLAVPATIAHLLCDRMSSMVVVAVIAAVLSALLGTIGAETLDTTTPAMMAAASGFLLMSAVVLAPGRGLIPRGVQRISWATRVTMEDLLGESLLASQQSSSPQQDTEITRTAPVPPASLLRFFSRMILTARGYLRAGEPRGKGLRIARALLKKRGLWRRFAAERLGLPPDHLDEPAHRIEHHIDEDFTKRIESGLDTDET